MNLKIIAISGLVLLTISHILLSQGTEFLQSQQPIDYTHWLMLLGAALSLVFGLVFPDSTLNKIAVVLSLAGVIAIGGMCAIDFALWSFGDDYENRDVLIIHLMQQPSIWPPFMMIGPALYYIGVSLFAWPFVRTHTLPAVLAIVGSGMIGLGQMAIPNRIVVVAGCVLLTLGLALLAYRKPKA